MVTTSIPTTFGSGTSPWTLAAWVNHTPDATLRRIFDARGTGGSGIYWASYTNLYVTRVDVLGNSDTWSGYALTPGTHFVVATYDGSAIRGYVDGAVPAGSIPVPSTRVVAPSSAPLVIGGVVGVARCFNGTIDEPAIWDRALSAQEIAEMYAAGISGGRSRA